MKADFNGPFKSNIRNIVRACGYAEIFDRRSAKISYVRRLGTNYYPRFHIYFDLLENGFRINLHLDQKKPSYKNVNAHSAEYDGELVENEMNRISQIINSYKQS
ncbi:MAG: hypothetical protein GF349_02830 [Candidatus Magasanikbacteria bacterium]|nr:hypothetical protein [Candidatus Magasanikbacteria bacterium]